MPAEAPPETKMPAGYRALPDDEPDELSDDSGLDDDLPAPELVPPPPVRRARPRSRTRPEAPAPVTPTAKPAEDIDNDFTWTLRVRVLPASAKITVDGKAVPTDGTILLTGREPITVSASADGYIPIVKVVSPEDDRNVVILLKRQPRSENAGRDEAL